MSDYENSFESFQTELYVIGDNTYLQCGFGNRSYIDRPERLILRMVIREIACGLMHSLILTNEGQVYAMGSNSAGQLGVAVNETSQPLQVTDLQGVNCIKIAAGEVHSVALADDRSAYIWGQGSGVKRIRQADDVRCGSFFTVFIDSSQLYLCQKEIMQALVIEKFTDFACSSNELLYLLDDVLFHYPDTQLMDGVIQLFSGYYIGILTHEGALYYLKDAQPIKLHHGNEIIDCVINKTHAIVISDSKTLIFDLEKGTSVVSKIEYHQISAGPNHFIMISQITKGTDSIIESPIQNQLASQTPQQTNNTFSFSIRKELRLINEPSHKQTQTDFDIYQENQELKKQLIANRKNMELQLQFHSTLQEQIKRLEMENQSLKKGSNKSQLLSLIRYKQTRISSLIKEFYSVHENIKESIKPIM